MNNNYNNYNNQLGFLDLVGLGSAGLGIYNTILNQKQISNDEVYSKLSKELGTKIDKLEKEIQELKNILIERS